MISGAGAKGSTKTPAQKAEKKQESRHKQWWYPKRCELEGCDKVDGLLKCGACSMVQYCCAEHQKQDWPIHKGDCKVFKRLGIRATFYTDEEMLEQFPFEPTLRDTWPGTSEYEDIPEHSVCPLCLKTDEEVDMTRTRCCGQAKRPEDIPDRLWRGLNAYNYCPMLTKDVPRHSLCETCTMCRGKLIIGEEGCAMRGHDIVCHACYRKLMGQRFPGMASGQGFADERPGVRIHSMF